MATHQQTARLDFLHKASLTLLVACPSLSRFYRSEFQQSLKNFEVTAAKSIDRQACPRCGQIYVPGLHTTVRLHSTKKKKTSTRNANQVRYQCHACHYTRLLEGTSKGQLIPSARTGGTSRNLTPAGVTAKPPAPPTHPHAHPKKSPLIQPKVAVTTASASPIPAKKKGKKNTLQALLAKSKQNNGTQKLGLDDFLSGL
ncbi:hypothetical protein BDF14DRAFT_1882121 [Spinellus fusiger]|nr:hypothetical protein BDF14DRAFT_1882121 [Spinellus fusiger]